MYIFYGTIEIITLIIVINQLHYTIDGEVSVWNFIFLSGISFFRLEHQNWVFNVKCITSFSSELIIQLTVIRKNIGNLKRSLYLQKNATVINT